METIYKTVARIRLLAFCLWVVNAYRFSGFHVPVHTVLKTASSQ